MYNPMSDNGPRTQFMGDQLRFDPMHPVVGENRVRRLGTISSGSGSYTSLTNDIVVTIDCKQIGKLINFENSYFTLDITNTNATPIYFHGKGGTHMIISEMTISTNSGTQFSYFRDYNVLMAIELAKHVDSQYLASWGSGMFGMSTSDIAGAPIANAGTVSLVLPLHLSNALKLFPMWGNESIEIRIKIANPKTAYIGAAIAEDKVTYSNVRFIYETVEIPPDSFNAFVKAKNNIYTISGKDWYSTVSSIPDANTAINIQIPINRACISKVIVALRTTADITTVAKNSLCSRNRGYYTESYLIYNGTNYPLLTVKSSSTSVAEMLAELAINNGNHLMNISSSFLNEPTSIITSPNAGGVCTVTYSANRFLTALAAADTDANSGYAFYEFYLGNSLENDDSTYSGLKVDNSTLALVLAGSPGTAAGIQTCNIFVEYQSKYTLQDGFWKVEY